MYKTQIIGVLLLTALLVLGACTSAQAPSETTPTPSTPPASTSEDIEWLARVIASEAGSVWDVDHWVRCTDEERSAVGWTVLNRLRSGTFGQTIKEVVTAPGQYAHNQESTSEITELAQRLLEGQVPDPTGGATYFFSPIGMPKEGEPTAGFDTGGGLQEVFGIANLVYFPSWAKESLWVGDLDNVRVAYFMFFHTEAPAPAPEPTLPRGFVKSGDFALAVAGMWEKPSVYGSKIMLVVAVRKLSPSIEDALATSQVLRLGHIELVDDQGESWQSATIRYGPNSNETEGWDGPIINMDAIPKDFTYITDLYTEAPGLALEHIRTIKIVPWIGSAQEVFIIDLALEPINEIEKISSLGEKHPVSKWLTVEVQGANDYPQSVRRELTIRIENLSYDTKSFILEGTYQTIDGRIRPNTWNYLRQIEGKISQVESLTFESWERQIGQLPQVRLYLVSVQTEGEKRFFIVRPD